MPIAQISLVASAYDAHALSALLVEASRFYAAALYPEMATPPVERVRMFITDVTPDHWATGGVPVVHGGRPDPYFTCMALRGRPAETLQAMMAGFTALIAKHLGCNAAEIRSLLIEIEPEHWFIGGVSASQVRAGEIASRAKQ